MTMEQELAIAVLNGDKAAAYDLACVLADRVMETTDEAIIKAKQERDARLTKGGCTIADGYEVYHWPEFRALCLRLGIAYEQRTTRMTISICEGEAVQVNHEYLSSDMGPQE